MKKMIFIALLILGLVSGIYALLSEKDSITYDTKGNNTVYQFTMNTLEGTPKNLKEYDGKVLLVVNVASKCGLTPQYEDLQKLYSEYQVKGLEILGFPANNFLGQEPGSSEEIASFCHKNYGVTFDMFEKISVKGSDIHPLYQFLTSKTLNGNVEAPVKWNFQKFLINKKGEVVKFFEPQITVYEDTVIAALQAELAK